MATSPLSTDYWYFPDPDTAKPIAGGSVYIGVADLDPTVLANRISVSLLQEDGSTVTLAGSAQPLTTSAGGIVQYAGANVVVQVSGTYSIKVLNSLGVQRIYNPQANKTVSTATINETGVLINGSFENQTAAAPSPDNWALSAGTNGTIACDGTDSAHGIYSLKFTGTDATGGGTATSDKFNVLEGAELSLAFTYKSSSATTLNKVDVNWYDITGSLLSTSHVYSEGAANPTVYTTYNETATVPATAVQADIAITGVDGTGTTTNATSNFDVVSVSQFDSGVTVNGTQTLSHKTFIAPALGTPTSGVLTSCTGTAAGLTAGNATKLATARTISITGGATGTATSFDGSANISIPVTALDPTQVGTAIADTTTSPVYGVGRYGFLKSASTNFIFGNTFAASALVYSGTDNTSGSAAVSGGTYVACGDTASSGFATLFIRNF